MDFYLKNKYLFEDNHEAAPNPYLQNIQQYLTKPRPVQLHPILPTIQRERIPQIEPLNNIFSQNARNLLDKNHNEKPPAPSYGRRTVSLRRDFDDSSRNRSFSYGQANSDNMKQVLSPAKPSGGHDPNLSLLLPKQSVLYNPLSHFDGGHRVGAFSSVPKSRNRSQNSYNERSSFKEPSINIPTTYGGILGNNITPNITDNPFKKIDDLLKQAGMRQNDNVKRYIPTSRNPITHDWEPPVQNKSPVRDSYVPRKSSLAQPVIDYKNYFSNEGALNLNKQSPGKSGSPSRRLSYNANSHRTSDLSTLKVTSVDPTEIRNNRFPHDDYQVLRRKILAKVELNSSENNPFQTDKPQVLAGLQPRLLQLNSLESRSLTEALERRLIISMIPERKELLKALLKQDQDVKKV